MAKEKRVRKLYNSAATSGRPIVTSWLSAAVIISTIFMPIVEAYLVVERRLQGHLQSYELVADEKNAGVSHFIDVETLAVDVATGVTYFLKNMHERMVITNVTIRDTFVSQDLKFDVIHGR